LSDYDDEDKSNEDSEEQGGQQEADRKRKIR
jgi:hypothetical protein